MPRVLYPCQMHFLLLNINTASELSLVSMLKCRTTVTNLPSPPMATGSYLLVSEAVTTID